MNEIFVQTPENIFNKAKQERTELKIAQNSVELAEKDIEIAKGAYLPSLTGFYGFNSRVTDITPMSFWDQFDLYKGHSFGLQLNIPIFNGFSTRNNVERTKINLDKTRLALEQTELDLERNIYTAYSDAKGARSEERRVGKECNSRRA